MRPLRIMATITAGQLCTGWVRAQARANKEQSTLRYQVEAAHKARSNIDKVGRACVSLLMSDARTTCSSVWLYLYARCMRQRLELTVCILVPQRTMLASLTRQADAAGRRAGVYGQLVAALFTPIFAVRFKYVCACVRGGGGLGGTKALCTCIQDAAVPKHHHDPTKQGVSIMSHDP